MKRQRYVGIGRLITLDSAQVSDTLCSLARPIRRSSIRYRDNKRLSAGVIIVHIPPCNPTPNAICPEMRQPTGTHNVPDRSSACAACPRPRRYQNFDTMAHKHKIHPCPTVFDPRWDAILAVTSTTARVCEQREEKSLRGTAVSECTCAPVWPWVDRRGGR